MNTSCVLLPGLDYLAGPEQANNTPSDLYALPFKESRMRSEDLCAASTEVNNTARFLVISFLSNFALSPQVLINIKTCATSEDPEYLGHGGQRLKIPFRSLYTSGCWSPSTGRTVDDRADL